jgi:RNA polymerase subunit RPABC4/transcription elongation factor Spt4
MPVAIFGIENTAINLGVTFLILALVAIWIALIVFTFGDARRRISDPFLIACATAASFFPFVGTIVYTILRPPEFLDDVNERETEMKASETRLRHLDAHSCRKCGFPVEADFVRCPACRSRLKEPCPSCERPVGLKWKVCPYCEHTLIESKRSRSGSKPATKKQVGRRRSGDREAEPREPVSDRGADSERRSPVKAAAPDDDADAAPTRRGRRRAARSDSAARAGSRERNESSDPESEGRAEASGRSGSDERPSRRSGTRRTVVTDEDLPPTRTINGGDSDGSGGSRPD